MVRSSRIAVSAPSLLQDWIKAGTSPEKASESPPVLTKLLLSYFIIQISNGCPDKDRFYEGKSVEKIGTFGIIFLPVKKAIILFLSLIPLAGTGQDEDSLVIQYF